MAYGFFKDFEEIGACFGRQAATIEGWADGGGGRDPGYVPTRMSAKVIDLFAECLGPAITPERAKSMIFGPVSWMENQFKAGNPTSLMQFMASEADRAACTLFRAKDDETGLIETSTEGEAAKTVATIRLNELFRMTVGYDLP